MHVCHWFSCISSKRSIAFFPYKQPVLKLMKNFVVLSNGEDLCSRERAIELVGIVAMFAGRTRMGSILPPFIEAAISVMNFVTLLHFGLLTVFNTHFAYQYIVL
ncbi:unnamed protein product [Cuscuta epithymum]|uniref:Uncharacterized protein n=1 Tax=Cuscuta epithymum TaxID=186058 RepID=A0AAV0E8T0_9ASTE|nr:unnamed protein product [Cuscuta epithymum]